jgi:1-acyl-sn-glycerol-3-phosphate acyltransferase
MKSAGYIEIDRHNREKALQSIDEAALRIRKGKSIMTFPEGTRSRDGEINAFKQGAFHLAIKRACPLCLFQLSAAAGSCPKDQ